MYTLHGGQYTSAMKDHMCTLYGDQHTPTMKDYMCTLYGGQHTPTMKNYMYTLYSGQHTPTVKDYRVSCEISGKNDQLRWRQLVSNDILSSYPQHLRLPQESRRGSDEVIT